MNGPPVASYQSLADPVPLWKSAADLEAEILSSAQALADKTSRISVAERLRELAEIIDPQE